MILERFYINTDVNRAVLTTGLSISELEHVVGRFGKASSRAGQLKGEIVVTDSKIRILHAFNKRKLWETSNESY